MVFVGLSIICYETTCLTDMAGVPHVLFLICSIYLPLVSTIFDNYIDVCRLYQTVT